jgi:quercetin 2,3-dioxygenase
MIKKIKNISSFVGHKVGEHLMIQPIPNNKLEQISPFLLLHHHGPHFFKPNNNGLPFGPHPHRGFETLTFIYSGEIEHKDSQGFSNVIRAGGVQWMTAASGIVHAENLSENQRMNGGEMEIIQLWMNLPAALKMTKPNYVGLQKEAINTWKSENNSTQVAVISGVYKDVKGGINSITDLQIFNIEILPDGIFEISVDPSKNILLYIINGEIEINGQNAKTNQLVEFDKENQEIIIKALITSRFLFAVGEPINEPMVAQGPFVMNTQVEINQAIIDYQSGKMGMM